MHLHYIAFAIPAIFLLIGIEYFASKKKKKDYFSFPSSVSNISIGIAERLAQLFLAAYFLVVFEFVYRNFSIFNIEANSVSWIGIFLLTDFLWYWYHRLSHEVNILWGAHIVHHQSEEYNLTVSLRITIFQAFVRLVFGLILPFIGFPVYMSVISIAILGVYQFFIHTQFIKKLGWLEHILVTPSHHRAHHGSNEIYLDKNYGGVLIIWDKLFHTFQEETEEVRYGLTKSVNSNSFLWLHFHFWLSLWEHFKNATGFKNKFLVLFSGPDKLTTVYDQKLREKYLSKSISRKIENDSKNKVLNTYVWIQLVSSLVALFFLYLLNLSPALNLLISSFIVLSIINCGAILEQKRWVLIIEIIRLAIFILFLIYLSGQMFLIVYLPALILALVADYTLLKKLYFKKVYHK